MSGSDRLVDCIVIGVLIIFFILYVYFINKGGK